MPYLDHAATTPMLPEALDAMTRHLGATGNPSSLHASGRNARRVVEESRETVAQALGARPSEVIFTAGGTEADNLALKGMFWARAAADPRRRRVVVSAIEHHAVLDSAEWLSRHEGAQVMHLPVDHEGRVRVEVLEQVLADAADEVALVSVMWANNEVGTLQPVAELAGVCRRYGVPVHSDAVQALAAVPLDFATSGLDAMTVTSHKIGGPLGVGALVATRETKLVPLLHGGGQERDVRSGTLDTPAVAGFAAAAEHAARTQPERAARLRVLRDDLLARLQDIVPEVVVNGSREQRLPGNVHVSFPGCEGDSLLLLLDARGIECSTGSACSAGVPQPSHVLLAMGGEHDLARGSLRFSLGHTSTRDDVNAVLAAIGPVVERARRAGLASVPAGA